MRKVTKFCLLGISLLTLTTCASTPAISPEDAATWAAAARVTETSDSANVSGCTLISPINFTFGADVLPPRPRGLLISSPTAYDEVLVYNTAFVGGNRALRAPDVPPAGVQRKIDEYLRSSRLSPSTTRAAFDETLRGTSFVVGEAYKCPSP